MSMTNTPKPEALVEQAREWASVVREADKQWSEPLAGLLQEAATTITTLAAERDALKEALERYGKHDHDCLSRKGAHYGPESCDCGFGEVRG